MLGLAWYFSAFVLMTAGAVSAQFTAQPLTRCGSSDSLAVVLAGDFPALPGAPVDQLTLLNYRDGHLSPITVQVDQRDAEGRFLLDGETTPGNPTRLLGPMDEIVFRMADAAARLPAVTANPEQTPLVEIEFNDPQTGSRGWVYAKVSDTASLVSGTKQITYNKEADSVETGRYKIGFSGQRPFLVDSFQWGVPDHGWSPNVLDAMKIRHQGKMFGFLSFRRTSNDYTSRLTHVKEGPLRIIRRTENRVRILWKLKTPALFIDYVMMPDSFIMDTIVDIPFNLGLVLRDVETLTTVDWRNEPALPELTIRSPATTPGLRVDGQMSAEKNHFNTISDTRLSIHSDYGSVSLDLLIPEDFAITPWLYLNDNAGIADRPETQPGQFGNVGYRTTGWENIDTEVHHLRLTTCVTPSVEDHGR